MKCGTIREGRIRKRKYALEFRAQSDWRLGLEELHKRLRIENSSYHVDVHMAALIPTTYFAEAAV